MSVELVSWKAGDPAIKAKPQVIKPKTWTVLTFEEGDGIVPKNNGTALWTYYINADDKSTDAKGFKARFIRDPKGVADFTGRFSILFDQDHVLAGNWSFNAKKGQQVSIQVYHEGKKDMIITTREIKMWIP
jgi:hypothetical protein